MRKEIDARKQDCPRPVIMTKKVLDELSEGLVTTIVDNEIAKENVSKLAQSLGLNYEVEEKDNDFHIHIKKGSNDISIKSENEIPNIEIGNKNTVILFGKDKIGHGNDELGKVLIKGFIYTLTEVDELPSTLLFLNAGVKLTTEGSEVIEDLKKLEEKGVEILSCGTCLDYYSLKEQLLVGGVTNMYTIVEKMKESSNTITL
ncbi:selenium metabolism protein YedF [Gottschalkia purinilytica]|uniref:Selenium metabolism protein YedF n=1 Tax=Gottschalkia purinilytica TaxID=1503 RepID=A0A0L0W6L1_GOTPU|nr:sulfurtransferase-like selenium metabolism protein YedF [Gottschalkia purinilytica]KNF07131.1 selenium metabolism protein YedF [Gottschalkia purinilytica]